MAHTDTRYAVVTGANRGIGLEVCKQLASNGVVVILTARDEKRGLEALNKLKESHGFSDDQLVFHQLDVSDSVSVASLAEFVKTYFGKLDILVNNAGVVGAKPREHVNTEYLKSIGFGLEGVKINWNELQIQSPEMAEECLKINYYGAKKMVEAFIPLLQLSDSSRIVNVSSRMGRLKNVSNEWAVGVLGDVENITEERIDEVLNEYLKDFREGLIEKKAWPTCMSANILSKAAMNAYTRILAKKYPNIRINCVCPGFVKTDINFNTGILTVEEGAESIMRLALLPNDGPSGCYFMRKEVSCF